MRLELRTIGSEQVPSVITECTHCGREISVPERDFLMTRPLGCTNCNHQTNISYREYVTLCNSFGHLLLAHAITKWGHPTQTH